MKRLRATRRPGPVRVLCVAAELHPLAKTGGLADVLGALPPVLAALGADVRLALPGYDPVLDGIERVRTLHVLRDLPGAAVVRLVEARVARSGLPVWVVDAPALFRRPGGLYQDGAGVDWPDNALRFGLFCHAVARLALGGAGDWQPDVVHAHDWHAGLLPYLLDGLAVRPATLFTVHNLAFQGNFAACAAAALDLPHPLEPGVEFYGQLSFLKAALAHADAVTTVSPTYAREITTPAAGCGLDGVLRARHAPPLGILNGIDVDAWNPATDPHVARRYSSDCPESRAANKRALQQRLGLDDRRGAPLLYATSRVTTQKMADVLADMLPTLLDAHRDAQFALLGRGERALEQRFAALAGAFPGRVAVRIGYDEADAHRLHAGGDVLLHGSRFEPCGLTQQYAMRYGAIPVVSRVGGLADTVVDAEDRTHAATGFVFDGESRDAYLAAAGRALDFYRHRRESWRELQLAGMRRDAGWSAAATQYVALYHRISATPLPAPAAVRGADGLVVAA